MRHVFFSSFFSPNEQRGGAEGGGRGMGRGRGGGRGALPDFLFLFLFPYSADLERGWPPCLHQVYWAVPPLSAYCLAPNRSIAYNTK